MEITEDTPVSSLTVGQLLKLINGQKEDTKKSLKTIEAAEYFKEDYRALWRLAKNHPELIFKDGRHYRAPINNWKKLLFIK